MTEKQGGRDKQRKEKTHTRDGRYQGKNVVFWGVEGNSLLEWRLLPGTGRSPATALGGWKRRSS